MSDIKLGYLITNNPTTKDAIHVAIAQVIAGEALLPGEHVGINLNNKAYSTYDHIGIVDPFLTNTVNKGDKFWLLLYSGTVKNLRHEWEHDSFIDNKIEPLNTSEEEDTYDCKDCD